MPGCLILIDNQPRNQTHNRASEKIPENERKFLRTSAEAAAGTVYFNIALTAPSRSTRYSARSTPTTKQRANEETEES